MRTLLFSSILCFLSINAVSQTIIGETKRNLDSPDGKYQFTFYQKQFDDGSRQMYYTLSFSGKEVVRESELGVNVDNKLFESALGIPNDTLTNWCSNFSFIEEQRRSTDNVWNPLYGERNTVKDCYNEMTLCFRKADGKVKEAIDDSYDRRRFYHMNIVVRAYDEGVAFRYHFPEATNGLFLHITGENTQFAMPEGTTAYYERWAQGPFSMLPLKNLPDESERPLTMKLPNGLSVAVLEAQMVDYSRMKLSVDGNTTLKASLYSSVDVITPFSTPWRVVMAAEKSVDLIANNDIILNLNPENRIVNAEWVRPGKVIRSGLSQGDAMSCIDFAAERGLQYVHLDAGWYGPEMSVNSDATTIREDKDIDMPALTAYAAEKGIGIFVYVNQRALYDQLDKILPLYKKWGIKGIKFGFVQIGNQKWSTWLHNAIKKCAEYEMLVDIHDEYRPTGFSRTYPNLLTQEGIRGNEEWPDATHNTILPFTRFLAGAGDYTICYYDKRLKNTHAHQLAMAAVYYSPLQFLYWYDNPKAYAGEPEIEFFDNVKTVWDDTKVLDGEIGEFVTIARRSGEEWFMGTIGNNEGLDISTQLSFLTPGRKYVASIYTDDDTVQTKTRVRVTRVVTDSTGSLNFNIKPRGGCAVHFVPASGDDIRAYKNLNRKSVF